MIQHLSVLLASEQLEEVVQGCPVEFPYSAIHAEMDRYADRCVSWHWHPHFEITIVDKGTLELHTEQGIYHLKQGDGCWINAGALHKYCSAGNREGLIFRSQLLDRALIARSDLIDRRYVGPLIVNKQLSALTFSSERDEDILKNINAAYSMAEAEPEGYELEVAGYLMQAWRGIFRKAETELKLEATDSGWNNERIRQMMDYVRTHYREDITPAMIASSVGICERECFRCFRQTLDTTPLKILTEYRINVAARMLVETNKGITEIAGACGFSAASYFGKIFRQKMGCTPGEYRKNL